MLKRLEIQCVFKELVKDIVVKGHLKRPCFLLQGRFFKRNGLLLKPLTFLILHDIISLIMYRRKYDLW